jgi:protein gp37
MSDGTSIEWADATWQPTLGCERVSPGCDKCYAMRQLHRGMCEAHKGLTKLRPKGSARPGVDWNGVVRLQRADLTLPLRWKKPRRVFVDSLSDLFHRKVPFEYIAAVFAIMARASHHTFMVLTKRDPRPFFEWVGGRSVGFPYRAINDAAREYLPRETLVTFEWPLPNVHLGVSVENQQYADERIPMLLECPAAVRWISAEPLLGPVNLRAYLPERATLELVGPELRAKGFTEGPIMLRRGDKLDWVVVGGESGGGARPFDVAWARQLVADCRRGQVAVFVKQLGGNVRDRNDANWSFLGEDGPTHWPDSVTPDDVEESPNGFREEYQGAPVRVHLRDRKGKEMHEWPPDLRVRETPREGPRP